jgi:CHAD domain-containing protein
MSYRLDLQAPVPDALRAVLVARLEHAHGALRDAAGPDAAAEAVHSARKDIKKARALLRLARSGLSSEAYKNENAALRESARSLSAAREADVLAESFELVAVRLVGQVPELELDALRVRVTEIAAALRPSAGGDATAIPEGVVDDLADSVARARALDFERCDTATLVAGSVRAYTRGAQALAVARHDTTAEHLHEWRKRAKDLWYQQRLLRDAWPELLKAQADAADRLTKLLGDDHDLAQLAEHLPGEPAVLEAVAELRTEIQADAWRLGRRLYAEKPKAFGRRLARYLAAG